ncbi:guanylate cyclase [Leptospira gomenensis]|uniref:Guanylate cyclase n=1 Tax=Leptospira gomenensis TaxID=2484974 RepID=A0A5F1YGW3_9LEPT|nr:adenylate/guanylate cyclase domain-containing protein [Leptospira gomenensis]TGK39209.1 guanylate cyclase [Leptospira gomenensis]TGK45080.1 guanylate cyclase [Leptospira gomenensis]
MRVFFPPRFFRFRFLNRSLGGIRSSVFSVALFIGAFLSQATSLQAEVKQGYLELSDVSRLYSLTGEWKFLTEDKPEFKEEYYDDSSWKYFPVAKNWHFEGYNYDGVAWFRMRFLPTSEFEGKTFGIMIPLVDHAYEVYLNGEMIGSRGEISTDGKLIRSNTRNDYFPIPNSFIKIGEENTIAFRIRSAGGLGGFVFSDFYFGEDGRVREKFYAFLLWFGSIAGIFFFGGMYHWFLFLGRKAEKQYFYFGCLSIVAGMQTMGIKTLGFWVWDNTWFNLYLNATGIILFPYLSFLFFESFFEYRRNLFIRISQATAIVVFGIFNLSYLPIMIGGFEDPYLYYGIFWRYVLALALLNNALAMPYALYITVSAIRKGALGGRTILAGFLAFGGFLIHGILSYVGIIANETYFEIGFLLFVTSMAVAMAFKFSKLHNESDRLNRELNVKNKELITLYVSYARFVPKEFLLNLGKESILDVKLGDQIEKEMTILFSDIRSFTELSEKMTPEENFNFINSYLKRMSPIIQLNNGYIDKFLGDGIMALFQQKVDDALTAAIEMQKYMITYNEYRNKRNYIPIRIGIGLHYGKLMLGTIGGEERMEGTVISDAVNLASRIESLTKLYGSDIIVSERALFGMDDPDKFHYRMLDTVSVKGKKDPVSVFEIFDGLSEEDLRLKLDTKAVFEKGIGHYRSQEFRESLVRFQEVLRVNPKDTAAKLFALRCEQAIQYGVRENWDSISRLT